MFAHPRPPHVRVRSSVRRWLTLLALAVALVSPRAAWADSSTAHSVAIAVLSLDSDDAEDQADALTGALRASIRTSEGWSLVDTTQSLGMLTAALRCPSKPIPDDCEERISEQLKADRYIYGYVVKGAAAGEVTAELHLYQRGKASTVVRESYADNLKDQNDDTLRKITRRLLDELGRSALGTIVVRTKSPTGEVVIDGTKRVPIEDGVARLTLAPGGHSVEVSVPGASPQKRMVLVTAGTESVVDVALAGSSAGAGAGGSSFPVRKVVGGGLATVGVVAGVVSVVNLLAWRDDNDQARAFQAAPENQADPKLPSGKTAGEVCGTELHSDATICKIDRASRRHGITAAVTGIGGGLFLLGGAYLLLTEGGSSEEAGKTSAKPKPKTHLAPTFGRGAGGFVLSGTF